MSTINYLDDYKLYDFFDETNSITIYKEGKSKEFDSATTEFDNLKTAFMEMIYDAFEMPAFGVSLDAETKQALKEGVWIKFNFKEQMQHNDLPFNALLVNVSPDFSGFNLIREINGEYTGRCFYLNLEKNMQDFYDLIIRTQI